MHYLHCSLQVFYQPVLLQDPETTPRGKSKHGLKLGPGCDLTKIFVKVCYSSSTHLRVKPRASGLQMLLAKSATSDFYIFIVNCVNQLKPKTTLKYSKRQWCTEAGFLGSRISFTCSSLLVHLYMEINNQSLQAVRELNETGGSNIRTVEKFISSTYDVEAEQVSQCDGHMDFYIKGVYLGFYL